MFVSLPLANLLAQGDALGRGWKFGWGGEAGYSLWLWLILGVLIGCVVGLIGWLWWKIRQEGRGPYYSPNGLFLELCRAHRLNALETLALQQLAVQQKPAAAGLLFIQPELWNLDPRHPVLGSFYETLESLRLRLFVESPE